MDRPPPAAANTVELPLPIIAGIFPLIGRRAAAVARTALQMDGRSAEAGH